MAEPPGREQLALPELFGYEVRWWHILIAWNIIGGFILLAGKITGWWPEWL